MDIKQVQNRLSSVRYLSHQSKPYPAKYFSISKNIFIPEIIYKFKSQLLSRINYKYSIKRCLCTIPFQVLSIGRSLQRGHTVGCGYRRQSFSLLPLSYRHIALVRLQPPFLTAENYIITYRFIKLYQNKNLSDDTESTITDWQYS